MQILDNLRASDGTGNAVLANVTILRTTGATVIKVDSVSKWPTVSFIGTYGTRGADGYLTSASVVEFVGHITAGDIIIDSFEPGFTDAGNSVGQVVVVKQTVGWANRVKTATDELQQEDITRQSRAMSDYVVSGGIWTFTTTLNGAMSALIAYQAGIPIAAGAIASRTFTASKDTYVDVLRGGTSITPTATIVYTEVVNNAAAPALAANSIRLAKVVTSGAAITSIVQNPYSDSLGNPIRPIGAIKSSYLQNPSAFSVYRNAGQSHPGGGFVKIAYDIKIFDNGNNFDNTTNFRFTAPISGIYQINTSVTINTQTRVIVSLYKNGVEHTRLSDTSAGTAAIGVGQSGGHTIQLLAGDYIEVYVYSGAASTISGITPYNNILSGFLISST